MKSFADFILKCALIRWIFYYKFFQYIWKKKKKKKKKKPKR